MPKKPARVPRTVQLDPGQHDDRARRGDSRYQAQARFGGDAGPSARVADVRRGPLQAERARPRAPKSATPGAASNAGGPEADLPGCFAGGIQAEHQYAAEEERVGAARVGAHGGRVATATA